MVSWRTRTNLFWLCLLAVCIIVWLYRNCCISTGSRGDIAIPFNGQFPEGNLVVMVIFGTRPEAVKMAPIIWELRRHKKISTIVCVTGQHREMIAPLLELFDILPDIDLNLMMPGQTLSQLTSRAILSVDAVLASIVPHVVLVQGDTTTAMAAGLAAFYHKIPVGHVEAGLRTRRLYFPFPEEMNRHVLGVITQFHFAPTKLAAEALRAETVEDRDIYLTGNTVIDTLLWLQKQPMSQEAMQLLKRVGVNSSKRLIVVTAHRRESFGDTMEQMLQGVKRIVNNNADVVVAFVVHMNPNVHEHVIRVLANVPRVHLLSHLSYEPFIRLLSSAYLILTDSGGIQEEASALHVPVLVMRSETERMEGVNANVAKLVGTSTGSIATAAQQLLDNVAEYKQMTEHKWPYGNGTAAKQIVQVLQQAQWS